ncbi:monovalent cation:proton antiporter-2 (CPA2) family protein [bacterium]|nr:monovalent cation:proton antiporter-2 (CPA2) family protein [bacterium]MBU1702714.1 monovalent cation:proton antiporter-2 (CPA2) family protein [Candidatus Eisenbacteria bacterium]MBU1920667.1 monovalent cation:proton antiporter-2 (CPA2) family protein [bacterium]
MHSEALFIQAMLYLAAAAIAVPIAKRLGLGSVLGYLLAGIAIGPFGLGLIGEEGQDVMHFAEFGVVMMLFLIGLELRPRLLWEMRVSVLGLGGAQVGITAAIFAGLGHMLGLTWQSAVAIGLTLALSSTALVLQSLKEKGLMGTEGGQSSFSVLLMQDIAVIPMLAVFPMLAVKSLSHGAGAHHGSKAGTWIESLALPGWAETLIVLGAVTVIVLGGMVLARPFFRFVAGTRLRETFTAAALLLVIGIAVLMTKVGLSPALGTFLAGVVLANSEYRHELESEIDPFKGLLLGVFFISVGASIDFGLVSGNPGLILAIVGALIIVKFIILLVLGRLYRMRFDQNLLFAFSLAQGGEFAFVLLSLAIQFGAVTSQQGAPLIASVALSMALTPLLMIFNERLIQPRFGTREADNREPDRIDKKSAVIVVGFGDFGVTIVRFLRANGVHPIVLENDSDRVDLLRRLGLKAYYGDARRRELLQAAGAEEARLLIIAVGDQERMLELIEVAQRHFPHLIIFARAAGWFESFNLLKVGVDYVYRQNADTALRTSIDALRLLGFRAHQIHRAAQQFQIHDDESMRALSEAWGDEKAYFSAARERIENLEKIMRAEREGEEFRDAGWDAESLRKEFGGNQDD